MILQLKTAETGRLGKFEPRQLSFAGQDGLEEFGTFIAISPFDLFIAFSYCSWVRKDLLNLKQIPPECLLEEYTMYYSPNIGPPEPANCKEECAQLAISKGVPFWSFNFKRNRCQFRRKGTGDQIQIFTRAIPTPLVTTQVAVPVLRLLQASFFYL